MRSSKRGKRGGKQGERSPFSVGDGEHGRAAATEVVSGGILGRNGGSTESTGNLAAALRAHSDTDLAIALRGCEMSGRYWAGKLYLTPADRAWKAKGERFARAVLEELRRRRALRSMLRAL